MRQDTKVIQGLKNTPTRQDLLQEVAQKMLAHPSARHIPYPQELEELARTGKSKHNNNSLRVKYAAEFAGEVGFLFEWPYGMDGYTVGLDSETGDEYILQPFPIVRVALPTTVDVPIKQLQQALELFKEIADFGEALEKEMAKESTIQTKTAQELVDEHVAEQQQKAARFVAEHLKGLRVGGTVALGTSPEGLERGKAYLATMENGRSYRVQIYSNSAAEIERQA